MSDEHFTWTVRLYMSCREPLAPDRMFRFPSENQQQSVGVAHVTETHDALHVNALDASVTNAYAMYMYDQMRLITWTRADPMHAIRAGFLALAIPVPAFLQGPRPWLHSLWASRSWRHRLHPIRAKSERPIPRESFRHSPRRATAGRSTTMISPLSVNKLSFTKAPIRIFQCSTQSRPFI